MIILLRVFYILFFGGADLILFSFLHKKSWFNKLVIRYYIFLVIVISILHTGLFKTSFLMPAETFFGCLVCLLFIVIMHFLGKSSIRRLYNPANRANVKIKDLFAQYWRFATMMMPYFFFFLGQCLWALSYPQ
jgi:hypothetical protein